jgi:hypothetical protein
MTSKPRSRPSRITFYFAGKVRRDCWRHALVPDLERTSPILDPLEDTRVDEWPVLERGVFGRYDYAGPYFSTVGHGAGHGEGSHGITGSLEMPPYEQWRQETLEENYIRHYGEPSQDAPLEPSELPTMEEFAAGYDEHDLRGEWEFYRQSVLEHEQEYRYRIVEACRAAIRACDVVFVWLEDKTAHGTLVELGYAFAYNKKIWIGLSSEMQDRDDLWFAAHHAEAVGTFTSAERALRHFLFTEAGEGVDGHVYILKSGRHYKIGKAKDVDKRVTQISPKTPLPVELLHSFPCEDVYGTERHLHKVLERYRTNGEWFELPPEIVERLRLVRWCRKGTISSLIPDELIKRAAWTTRNRPPH